jgi:hypothetical protein
MNRSKHHRRHRGSAASLRIPPSGRFSAVRRPVRRGLPDRRVAGARGRIGAAAGGSDRARLYGAGSVRARPSAVARTRFIDDVITAEVDGDPTLHQLVIPRRRLRQSSPSIDRRPGVPCSGGSPCDAGDQTSPDRSERHRPVHPVTYAPSLRRTSAWPCSARPSSNMHRENCRRGIPPRWSGRRHRDRLPVRRVLDSRPRSVSAIGCNRSSTGACRSPRRRAG